MSSEYNFQNIDHLISEGGYDKAIEELNRYLVENPDNTEALWRIGVAYTEKNDPLRAMKALDFFFRFEKDHPQALEAKGCAHFKMGEYTTAREYLEKAAELQPDGASIKRNLGVVFNQLGMKKEAYDMFKASHALNPEDYRTEYALVMSHIHFSEYNEAEKVLLQMLSQQLPDDFRELADESYRWIKQKLGREKTI